MWLIIRTVKFVYSPLDLRYRLVLSSGYSIRRPGSWRGSWIRSLFGVHVWFTRSSTRHEGACLEREFVAAKYRRGGSRPIARRRIGSRSCRSVGSEPASRRVEGCRAGTHAAGREGPRRLLGAAVGQGRPAKRRRSAGQG